MTIKKLPDNTRCTDVLGKCAFYFRRRKAWREIKGMAESRSS